MTFCVSRIGWLIDWLIDCIVWDDYCSVLFFSGICPGSQLIYLSGKPCSSYTASDDWLAWLIPLYSFSVFVLFVLWTLSYECSDVWVAGRMRMQCLIHFHLLFIHLSSLYLLYYSRSLFYSVYTVSRSLVFANPVMYPMRAAIPLPA